jgi:aminotransferase
MKVADRMSLIPFSGIRKVFEEATRREKLGEKIIHLEIGRPDYDTPLHIKEAAKIAIDEGKVHYSSNYGIAELREVVARKFMEDNGLSFDPSAEIIITVGANEAVFMTMMGLLNPGDEVLIPDPCWLNYFYCIQMAGAIPVSVPLREENDFNPDVDAFRARVTPKTRMMIINTPNNPTGAVFSREVLEELARFAVENDLLVLSDEIYEKLVYEDSCHVSIGSFPGMRDRTVTLNGFSKIYSMTGWRLGYVAAAKELTSALIRIHQYTTVCAATFAQWGAVEALNGPQEEARKMVEEFDRRRRYVYEALKGMPGVHVVKPQGAFYILPNIKAFGKTPEELTAYLLDKAQIAVLPGTALGEYGKDFIRISYANSYDNLKIAMERMKKALGEI